MWFCCCIEGQVCEWSTFREGKTCLGEGGGRLAKWSTGWVGYYRTHLCPSQGALKTSVCPGRMTLVRCRCRSAGVRTEEATLQVCEQWLGREDCGLPDGEEEVQFIFLQD